MSVKCVDGKINNEHISNVFRDKLSSASATFNDHITNFSSVSTNGVFITSMSSVEVVDKLIFQQKKHGKAAGNDNL